MTTQVIDGYRSAGRILALAAGAQMRLPRGQGAVPRLLGRTVGRKPRFITTRHGAHLAMAANSWDVYSTMALHGGSWDYHDFEWCVNGTPDSGVFYDIGANVGYFSVEMAKTLGRAVSIVAFEPQAELAAAITESTRLNRMDNIKVVSALVGDAPGQAELYLARASIHASAVVDSGRGTASTVPAQMVTVDDLVDSGEIPPPDMVKMDVEGSEHLVLRGARRTLRAHVPHVFLEYLVDYDPGQRVRQEVRKLVADCPDLEIFGHAATSTRPYAWFRMRDSADWTDIDSLFLKNRRRPVRRPDVFESEMVPL